MGFNQEIKDFIAGWQGVNKIGAQYDDSAYKRARTSIYKQQLQDMMDPQMRQLKMDSARSVIDRNKAYSDYMRGGSSGGGGTPDIPAAPFHPNDDAPPIGGAASGKTSALGDEGGPTDYDGGGGDPTQFAASGGLILPTPVKRTKAISIQHFEDGGMVADDDDDDQSTAAVGVGAGDGHDDTTENQPYGGLSPTAAHDAALHGMVGLHQEFGIAGNPQQRTALPSPGGGGNVRSYLQGKGAAGPMLTDAVLEKVDPGHKLSESQRNMAGLSAVWQFYMDRGEPEKARRAAGALLQQHRVNAHHYAAIAAVALEHGNITDATRMAAKAYANVPSGKDLQFSVGEGGQIIAQATDDATGKVVSKKVLTPQQLGAALRGIKPEDFDAAVMEAAGEKLPKNTKPKAIAPEKAGEIKTRGELLDSAMPAPAGDKPDPKAQQMYGNARSIADALLKHNGGHPGDAAKMAQGLLDPKASPKVTPRGDGSGADYQFPGGPKMFIPADTIERLSELRAEAAAEAKAADDKKRKEGEQAGVRAEAVRGIADTVGSAAGAASDALYTGTGMKAFREKALPVVDSAVEGVKGAAKRGFDAAEGYVKEGLKRALTKKPAKALDEE